LGSEVQVPLGSVLLNPLQSKTLQFNNFAQSQTLEQPASHLCAGQHLPS